MKKMKHLFINNLANRLIRLSILSSPLLTAQTIITETGFKVLTKSPIVLLTTLKSDEISFYSDCVHCKYGHPDFHYFKIDLKESKVDTIYKEFALGARITGELPVSKYPSKSDTNFNIKNYKEVEFNVEGNIDTYNLYGKEDYAYRSWQISGERFVYLAKSKYYETLSLFTGNSKPVKTGVSFSKKEGFCWISDFYSCDLNNRSFISIKKTNYAPNDLYHVSESSQTHYVYIINNSKNEIEQEIIVYNKEMGVGDVSVFYPLADSGDFVVIYHKNYGYYDKNNKNYGVTMHYYSSNNSIELGKYSKIWETKLSSDFTSIGAISVANGQIIVGGSSRNGGYLGYENPYINIFDVKTGKHKKEYYIPFKSKDGEAVYNIVPLQTSAGISPTGKSVNRGLYGGNNGDLLICCQPFGSNFKESGIGTGILVRDYLNADGTFYNNLFNDNTWGKNIEKKSEKADSQLKTEDKKTFTSNQIVSGLPKFSEKFDVLMNVAVTYSNGVDKTYNNYSWVAQDKFTKKLGIVSDKGNITIPFEYDFQEFVHYSKNFEDNKTYFILTKDGKKGVVDMRNNIVIDFEYDNYWYGITLKAECNYAVGLKDGKYGVISLKDGSVLLDFKYDKLNSLNYGYDWEPCDIVGAQLGTFSGFIDFKGNIFIDNKDIQSGDFLEEFEKRVNERNVKERQ
jgi:hypothetical protein